MHPASHDPAPATQGKDGRPAHRQCLCGRIIRTIAVAVARTSPVWSRSSPARNAMDPPRWTTRPVPVGETSRGGPHDADTATGRARPRRCGAGSHCWRYRDRLARGGGAGRAIRALAPRPSGYSARHWRFRLGAAGRLVVSGWLRHGTCQESSWSSAAARKASRRAVRMAAFRSGRPSSPTRSPGRQ